MARYKMNDEVYDHSFIELITRMKCAEIYSNMASYPETAIVLALIGFEKVNEDADS